MKIKKSKEVLVLTQVEKIILSKAQEYLDEIYEGCECNSNIGRSASEAQDYIDFLLEEAEVEEGEPKGEITISILM